VADGPGDHSVHAHQGCCRRTRSPFYGPESFTYLPESNSYICPGGQQLNYGGRNERNRTFGHIGTRKKCGPCQQRSQCTTGPFRYFAYPHERDRSAADARSLDYTGVQVRTTTSEEGRGALRGAKESKSHRSQSAPAAQVEVRTRTVLPSGHCPEHQAAGPVPQPASDVAGTRHFIGRTVKTDATTSFNPQNDQNGADFFNTHTPSHLALLFAIFRRRRRLPPIFIGSVD
jgi:hypothetical protein